MPKYSSQSEQVRSKCAGVYLLCPSHHICVRRDRLVWTWLATTAAKVNSAYFKVMTSKMPCILSIEEQLIFNSIYLQRDSTKGRVIIIQTGSDHSYVTCCNTGYLWSHSVHVTSINSRSTMTLTEMIALVSNYK